MTQLKVYDGAEFEKPDKLDAQLWRYMDFTKYVSLLQTSSLFFSRADLLGDPLEGSFTAVNEKLRPELYKDKIPAEGLELLRNIRKAAVKRTYVSCWHMNEYESAAMWSLYAKSDEAVVITSTFQKLQDVLPKDFCIGMVQYVDYDADLIAEQNIFSPFMCKRKSFEHEREVRAVHIEYPESDIEGKMTWSDAPSAAGPAGITLSVNLNDFLTTIKVSPASPDWYFAVVESVTKKYGVSTSVVRSDITRDPIY